MKKPGQIARGAGAVGLAVMLTAPALARGAEAQQPLPLTEYTVKTMYSAAEGGAGGSYPRVIELEHGPDRGQLLATFGSRGGLPIYRSTDAGDSWQQIARIEGLGQPALFELPARQGDFPAGTLYAAGMATNQERTTTSLDVHYSTDRGRSWQYLSTIITGGRPIYNAAQRAGDTRETPVWEPFLYTDASGRLVAYYSSETRKNEGYNQLLAHKVSEDGGRTWGPEVLDVAIPDTLTRPGMSIVTRMGEEGPYILTYEVVSKAGYPLEPRSNPTHFKLSEDGLDFGDPTDAGTLIQDRRRQYLNATPYVAWSPYGGPEGTLIAGARGVMREDHGQQGNGLFINRDGGEGYWTLIETPISWIPGPSGYSSAILPLGDGREILHIVSVDGNIRYSKFLLPEEGADLTR